MRVYSAYPISITDIDRGLDNKGIYEAWNAKSDTGISASGFIDLLDTERVMLSVEMGQIKKYKTAGSMYTEYSITGTAVGPFTIVTGVNDTFNFLIGAATYSITLPAGVKTVGDIATVINSIVNGASGFAAEESVHFFRSSFMAPVTDKSLIDGPGGKGYGQRGPSIISGFLVLVCDNEIVTLGAGNANLTLGFVDGSKTLCK